MPTPYLLTGQGLKEANLRLTMNEAVLVKEIKRVLPTPGAKGKLFIFSNEPAHLRLFVDRWRGLLRGRVKFGPAIKIPTSSPVPYDYPTHFCLVRNISLVGLGLLLFMGAGLGAYIMERRSNEVVGV